MSRELDAQVAKGLGDIGPCDFNRDEDVEYLPYTGWYCVRCGHIWEEPASREPAVFAHKRRIKNYSTDIAAAWQVVEWMRAQKWDCYIEWSPSDWDGWLVAFHYFTDDPADHRHGSHQGKDVHEAICLAFLEARGDDGTD